MKRIRGESSNLISLLLTVLVTAGNLALPVQAQCPVQVPLSAPEAEGDPLYAVLCGLRPPGGQVVTPLPCPVPETVVVDRAWDRAQGMVLTARTFHPTGGRIFAIWWKAEVVYGTSTQVLWTQRTTEGIPALGLPVGTTVRYGAPGLREGATHRFSVAFEAANGSKTCWAPSTDSIPTPDFVKFGPPEPASMGRRVQDDFDRPATVPVSQNGDGLGPRLVWTPSDVYWAAQTCEIADDQSAAWVTPTSGFTYERLTEGHDKTYAEMEVRVDRASSPVDPGFRYNLQVQARVGATDPTKGSTPSHAAKLLFGPRGCTQPAIVLFRLPEVYGQALCEVDGTGHLSASPGGVICDGTTGHEIPPMDQADPNDPTRSQPVWLRIEVQNNIDGEPVIVGRVRWQDAGGAWHVCETGPGEEWTDRSAEKIVTQGKWGASFHDRRYFVNVFRAGDGSAPPVP